MNDAIATMLKKYNSDTTDSYIQALREIMQEIALLGLYRSKFFEHAAFYGGTALRIIYGLDRFSEDLDFSLLKADKAFDLSAYSGFLEREMEAYGFRVSVEKKNKAIDSQVQSAFLKADTINELLVIEAGASLISQIPHGQKIKIKIEVDTAPPLDFTTDVRYLLLPTPFSVKVFSLPDLFAGKMHALLFRRWGNRVKGRDLYDFVWYLTNHPQINLNHLKARMVQSGDWDAAEELTLGKLKQLYLAVLESTDIEQAKREVMPFVKEPEKLNIWSKDFFTAIVEYMKDK
jgi:predicted nucleotidyltransferase component of viral defense system